MPTTNAIPDPDIFIPGEDPIIPPAPVDPVEVPLPDPTDDPTEDKCISEVNIPQVDNSAMECDDFTSSKCVVVEKECKKVGNLPGESLDTFVGKLCAKLDLMDKKIVLAGNSGGGTTGDYIPLTGTEEGNPVTGSIIGDAEFDKQSDRTAFAQLSDVYDANSYSTNEIKTGGTWIDGKPIYRKAIPGITDANGYWNLYDLHISMNVHSIISIKALNKNPVNNAYTIGHETYLPPLGSLIMMLPIAVTGNTPYIEVKVVVSGYEDSDAVASLNILTILEYTKTTDPTS